MSVTIQISGTDRLSMNLSNRNFCTLWAALGLDPETEYGYVGSVDSRVVQERVSQTSPDLVIREGYRNDGPEGPVIIDCGITEEQVKRYFQGLTAMCREAERMESLILWS